MPHVRWMFARRREGGAWRASPASSPVLGVPCPSDVDPARNRHRCGGEWALRTVAVILGNPRYTGRQVRNRQAGDRPISTGDARRSATEWAISAGVAHPALVSESDFVAARAIRATRPTKDGSRRRYVLSGLLRCALCGRRLDAHWVHGRAGYRCRGGYSCAGARRPGGPRFLYVRDVLVADLTARLASNHGRAGDNIDVAAIVSPATRRRNSGGRSRWCSLEPRAGFRRSGVLRGVILCPRGDLNPHPLLGD